jgi:hypothetical protein
MCVSWFAEFGVELRSTGQAVGAMQSAIDFRLLIQFVIPKRRLAVEESAFCRRRIRCKQTAGSSPLRGSE